MVAGVSTRSSSQAKFPAQVHDVKAAIRWLRAHAGDYRIDPRRIAAMGDSSGGWTATMAGVTGKALEGSVGVTGFSSGVRAVVDLYGPTDFLRMDPHMLPGACESFNVIFGLTDCHSDPRSPESSLLGCPVRAHAASGDERDRLWQRWREIDKNLDEYAALRPTETAVVVLAPR